MTDRTNFEETYPVQDDYKRFNPMNTAFARAMRANLRGYNNESKKIEKMKKEVPGFSLVDYAFRDAALTTAQASRSGRGQMNSGFYSWSPLGVAHRPEGVPKWDVSPEKASKVVSKAARYYGAAGVGFCELDTRWVYSHTNDGRPIVFEDVEEAYVTEEKAVVPESHRWIIAITVPMEVEEMMYSPAAMNPVSNMGYSRMPVVAGSVAEFIRGLGYHAIPCGNPSKRRCSLHPRALDLAVEEPLGVVDDLHVEVALICGLVRGGLPDLPEEAGLDEAVQVSVDDVEIEVA